MKSKIIKKYGLSFNKYIPYPDHHLANLRPKSSPIQSFYTFFISRTIYYGVSSELTIQ